MRTLCTQARRAQRLHRACAAGKEFGGNTETLQLGHAEKCQSFRPPATYNCNFLTTANNVAEKRQWKRAFDARERGAPMPTRIAQPARASAARPTIPGEAGRRERRRDPGQAAASAVLGPQLGSPLPVRSVVSLAARMPVRWRRRGVLMFDADTAISVVVVTGIAAVPGWV
jgi:hypothetical protein